MRDKVGSESLREWPRRKRENRKKMSERRPRGNPRGREEERKKKKEEQEEKGGGGERKNERLSGKEKMGYREGRFCSGDPTRE